MFENYTEQPVIDSISIQTSSIRMSGKEKAARLIAEIGSSAAREVLAYLSPKEKKKILKGFKITGTKYNPWHQTEVQCELDTLLEAERFGKRNGIYREVIHSGQYWDKQNGVSPTQGFAQADPRDLAKILSVIMQEGN